MDTRVGQATVHGVLKSDMTEYAHIILKQIQNRSNADFCESLLNGHNMINLENNSNIETISRRLYTS